MEGEKELKKLLKTIKPVLHDGDYVFCTAKEPLLFGNDKAILLFREEEGTTIVLKKEVADQRQLQYSFVAAWITLTVHSSLQAVGFTAAFSNALARVNISCNVVAGYFHDHLFVDKKYAEKALLTLRQLSEEQ